MIDLIKIDKAKHIVLVCDGSSFANASAIYSFILTQHKKVSLVCETPLALKFSFLPWFEKVRSKIPSSSDYRIEVERDALSLYNFFQENSIKINKKMAMALYAGVLLQYDFFRSVECSGMVFATASQLIELGASHQESMHSLQYSQPLAYFRLQSILYESMLLSENATVALLFVSQEDLKTSGATMEDAFLVMNDVLHLVHIQEVRLIQKSESKRVLKSVIRR